MTEVHVCLFPELNPDYSNNGNLCLDIYDSEDEIEDRKKIAHMIKGPNDPGWHLWYYMPISYAPNSGQYHEIRIGIYPYIANALQDVAYLLGQYWSPNR